VPADPDRGDHAHIATFQRAERRADEDHQEQRKADHAGQRFGRSRLQDQERPACLQRDISKVHKFRDKSEGRRHLAECQTGGSGQAERTDQLSV